MPLVINSNIQSLNSQRQLVKSGMEQDQAMERLSSGKRINTAADDAAGLAISNRQTSQINGLNRAVANANDGVSLIQTAEGALDETTNILQRMRELSVQSANGIYSNADRATLDAEVQQLKAEVDRIAQTTSFNGQNILDGTQGTVALQVGAESNQTISFNIGELDADSLGGSTSGDIVGASVLAGSPTVAGNVTINGQVLTAATLNAATTTDGFVEAINTGVSGVVASASTRLELASAGTGVLRGTDILEVTFGNADGSTNTIQIADTGTMEELAASITSQGGDDITASLTTDGKLVIESASGASISLSGTAAGAADVVTAGTVTGVGMASTAAVAQQMQLSLTATDGKDITVAYADATDALDLGIDARTDAGDVAGNAVVADAAVTLLEGQIVINGVGIGAAAGTAVAQVIAAINDKQAETGVVATGAAGAVISLNSVDDTEISIELGTAAGAAATLAAMNLLETNTSVTTGNSIADVDVSTAAGAQSAIDTIDTALEQINATRSDLGAVNNRLDFTVSNLMNVSENTAAARSQILDADFASETASLSRAQVLQQAASAMLAQANAAPQQVLSLLR